MEIHGHTALVTGGAVRIGAELCRRLALEGCRIIIHCNKSRRAADALCGELQNMNAEAFVVQTALAGEKAAEDLMQAAWEAAGNVDILINNAAVYQRGELLSSSEADFLRHWQVNLLTPLLLTKALVKRHSENHSGTFSLLQVVNILDRRVSGVSSGCIAYHLSKTALAEATRVTALELAPHVKVNAVAPGPVLPPPDGSGVISEKAGSVPLNSRPRPADVAEAVVYLLRTENVTGQILFVDGGQHLLGRWEDE